MGKTPKKYCSQYRWREVDTDGQLDELIDYYAHDGTYILTDWSRSSIIETPRSRISLTDRIVGSGYLTIIAMTKAHVRKRMEDGLIKTIPQSGNKYHVNPSYFACGPSACVDVRSAYITSAYHIGALSEKMYKMLMGCAKTTRLAALGSLGSRKTITTYMMSRKIGIENVEDLKLHDIWDRICDNLNLDIAESVRGIDNNLIGYWVDNIYVREQAAASVAQELNARGYETRIEKGPIKPEMEKHFERLRARGLIPKPKVSARRREIIVRLAHDIVRRQA